MSSFTRIERLLSLFTVLRPGEGRAALQLCAQSFILMFAYYLLKVIREPMILADGSAELRAYSTALQAGLLMLAVPVFTRMYQQAGLLEAKHHLFRNTLLFFITNLLGFAAAFQLGVPVAVAFYVWLGIFSVMILALFWAFSADLFNYKSGQRLFPVIAAAGAFGALAGSGLANYFDMQLGHGGVMWTAAFLLMIPWYLSSSIEEKIPAGSRCFTPDSGERKPYPLLKGFKVVLQGPYMALIAALVIVLNLINTNGEYILASFVTAVAPEQASALGQSVDQFITGFYADYLFLTTLLSFLIQLLLVARVFNLLGVAGSMYVLPVLMIVSYSLLALLPILAVARIAMIAENSVNYSLQTTARHALFLPVERLEKYVGKQTIDTFFFRLGDLLSGGFVYLASVILGMGIVGFISVNVALAGLLLLITVGIAKLHHKTCADRLPNMPPVVAEPLEDMFVPAGRSSQMQLDADTFIDPDVGDALRYAAFAYPAEELPPWINFDGLERRFLFSPPASESGQLRIKVVASDYEGLEAEVCFMLNYGN